MNLKASKKGFKENHESTDHVYCCTIGCHGNSLLHFEKSVMRDF